MVTRTGSSARDEAAGARGRRDIGPIGTATRVGGGLIAIALPVALQGIGWWDLFVALVVLPLIATSASALVTAAYERFAPAALARRHAICSGPGCSLILVILAIYVGITFLTPLNGDVAFWIWIGASLLLAAARGYGGCEVLAIPNLIMGRRDRIGCMIYTPIDMAEMGRRLGREGPTARAGR
jgi:Family of unknown function (DUF6410)